MNFRKFSLSQFTSKKFGNCKQPHKFTPNKAFSNVPLYRSTTRFHSQLHNGRELPFPSKRNIIQSNSMGNGWLIFGVFAFAFAQQASAEEKQSNEEECEETEAAAGEVLEGLPEYTLDEISKHNSRETRIWVTFRNGVYDVTDFIDEHPGGIEKIMLAAGKAIDPYWNLYAVHKTAEIFNILELFRIGNVAVEDREKLTQPASTEGPYANEPTRSPIFHVHSATPFNAEPPSTLLAHHFLTPNDLFYVRNHLPVPQLANVKDEDYMVEIVFESDKFVQSDRPQRMMISLKDLKASFSNHSIVAALQCSGNRRLEMNQVKDVLGLSWETSAISNARWTGVKLYDVLLHAGFDPSTINSDQLHVQFEGVDTDITGSAYGASIPLNHVINPTNDVLLAFLMNDEKLPADHGYPLRVVLPGVTGARNVKWLKRIVISDQESTSHWQRKDYKLFASNVQPNTADWDHVNPINDLPIQSAILSPSHQSKVRANSGDDEVTVNLKGFAWSGGGRGVARVEISTNGETWQPATLVDNNEHLPGGVPQGYGRAWAWTLWEAEVNVPTTNPQATFYCRAVDTSGNFQPHSLQTVWNFRGLGNNAWHKINVDIVKE